MSAEIMFPYAPAHWEATTLGELASRTDGNIQTGPFGSQLHARDYVEDGIPSIMPKNISIDRVLIDDIARVSPKDVERLSKYKVQAGDIVYSRRGDIEKCVRITPNEDGWLCGTGCLRVRVSPEEIPTGFLHAYLCHPTVREWIVRHSVGATMPNLNTSILSALPVVLPSKPEMNQISSMWLAWSEKIQLNQQINQTLEQMAQSLFKSWFVDFEPVKAKIAALEAGGSEEDSNLAAMQAISGKTLAELQQLQTENPDHYQQLYTTAQHFPSSMQESELGKIPEGWLTPTFEELTTAKQGKYLSKDKMSGLASETNQIPVWGGNGILGYCETATYDESVVLMTCRGSNCGLIKYTQSPSHVSNNSFACQPSIGSVWFLLTYLKNQTFSDCISGSAQPQITYTSLKTKKLTIPVDKALCILLSNIIQPNFEQILKNEAINQTLSELRDQLLPKLLSGELSVENLES